MILLTRITPRFFLLAAGIVLGLLPSGHAMAQEYSKATKGTRVLEGSNGLHIKVLVEAANLGGTEVDIGEITFPPGQAPSRGHRHATVEIFYVLSGRLDHVVNGESHVLEPGMVGIVRPGDDVIHRVASDEPVKALVIWAPGGEAERLARFFQERAIDEDGS